MATKITSKPSAPSNVSISRSGTKIKLSWKQATTTGSSAVQHVRLWFDVDRGKGWERFWGATRFDKTLKSHTFDMGKFPEEGKLSNWRGVRKVRYGIDFENEKGNSGNVHKSITFTKPAAPSASIWAENEAIHYSVSMPSDTETAPLFSTSWRMQMQPYNGAWQTVASGSGSASGTLGEYHPVNPEPPRQYRIVASATGLRGESTLPSEVRKVLSRPSKPSVDSVARASTSYTVNWSYDTAGGWRPVDKFEVLYGDTEQSAASCGSWQSMVGDVNPATRSITRSIEQGVEVGMKRWFMVRAYYNDIPISGDGKVFDGLWGAPDKPEVTASANVVTVKPSANHSPNAMVYVEREQEGNSARIGSFLASAGERTFTDNGYQTGAPYRYSAYVVNSDKGGLRSETDRSESFVTPNEVFLKSWRKSDDCETAFLAWDEPSGTVDGYEVAWAEKPDAFQSNEEPDTLEVDGGETTAVRISGLKPGKTYWFWIRSVANADGNTGKGNWNGESEDGETARLTMANPPDKPMPVLSASYAVIGMDDTSIGWNYSALGDAPLTGWSIEAVHADDEPWTLESDAETFLDGSATIASSTFAKGTWLVYLTLTNMAGSTTSDPTPLKVVAPPEVSMTTGIAGGVVTALPITLTAASAGHVPVVEIYATKAMQVELPSGLHAVFEDEVVWSGTADGAVSAEPQLYENGEYAARAYAVDRETGLVGYSEPVPFTVSWAHQAVAGTADIVPDAEAVSCEVSVAAPEDGFADGDYCSLWRVTSDGVSLVSASVQFGETIVDDFAPYGSESCGYRVCTHTKDGDFQFADYPSGLEHDAVRIDFGGSYVDLPYNISSGDSRTKDSAIRKYLDGSKAAAIRRGVNRSHSIASDLIRNADEPMVEACYALSRHEGVCFVRMPSGIAYAANVNVSVDRGASTPFVSIGITAEEVDYDGEFAGRVPDQEADDVVR